LPSSAGSWDGTGCECPMGLGALRYGVKGVLPMAFSVAMSRPFRSLGLFKSTGRHAAPKGAVVPAPRESVESVESESADGAGRHPTHAATMPRLTGPHAESGATAA
jgi:hypothetical protein